MRIYNANIFTPLGLIARHGSEMNSIVHIPDGVIDIDDRGIITYVGPKQGAVSRESDAPGDIDAAGLAVIPGFVDSHTHLPFGGFRPYEFAWRMRGDSYMSIMERGGGIVNTMGATRNASSEELMWSAQRLIDPLTEMGVTTIEGKSGYGLDCETEIRQLEVLRDLDKDCDAQMVATYLGAHAVPPEFAGRTDDYVDFMISEMLPLVKERGLAANCDVFCEKGVFTVDQSRRLLLAAKDLGFGLKVHADEIVNTGGAELAAEIGALSADHLLHISDYGIQALAGSSTVATLLPLTAFCLREPYAPARRMIDEGCAVALASDLNPGSCFSASIPLMIAIACIYMDMTVEETLTALTLNGAAALGMAGITGSIEVGKRADISILNFPDISFLPYHTGMNCVVETVRYSDFKVRH